MRKNVYWRPKKRFWRNKRTGEKYYHGTIQKVGYSHRLAVQGQIKGFGGKKHYRGCGRGRHVPRVIGEWGNTTIVECIKCGKRTSIVR